MTNKERNLIKRKIVKCLTEDFKNNQAIFDKASGWQVFNGTDLDMVMNAVVKGLEMAKNELNDNKDRLQSLQKELEQVKKENHRLSDWKSKVLSLRSKYVALELLIDDSL